MGGEEREECGGYRDQRGVSEMHRRDEERREVEVRDLRRVSEITKREKR